MKIMMDLFERQVQNLYNSEILVLYALPEMLEHATDRDLCRLITDQVKVTSGQRERLERTADYLEIRLCINDGKVIRGLIEEIHDLYSEFPRGTLLDVGIISKIQHIQHFQISAYETAMLYIQKLNLLEILDIFEETVDEAYEADERCGAFVRELLLGNGGARWDSV